jgi:uncharacterized protein (DUF4415 family)
MAKKNSIVRVSAAQAKTKKGQTDWAALRAMKNSDIDTSDLPELNKEFWKVLRVVKPQPKAKLSLTLDQDIARCFKGKELEINAILRAYVESRPNHA